MASHTLGPCLRSSMRQFVSQQSRSLSTTSARLAADPVPPESPSYIRLPPNFESEDPKPSRVKGHLPIPRQVFNRQDGDRKVKPEYIQKTAPVRTKNLELNSDAQRWKAKMADSRRKNLEGSLQDLWKRHSRKEKARDDHVRRIEDQQRKAKAAPERRDDRFTRGTILDSVLDTKIYPDPDRFTRVDRSRTKVYAKEAAKREARRDALVELYVSSTNFIVDEAQLQAKIEQEFAEDHFSKLNTHLSQYGATENVWGTYGSPQSISNMLMSANGAGPRLTEMFETEHDRSVKRQKRISEEFTGGKME